MSAMACSGAAFAGAPIVATPTSGLAAYPTATDTFAIGADGHVRELTAVGGVWTPYDLTAALHAAPAVPGSPLSTIVTSEAPYSLLYLGANGHVHKLSRDASNNTWSYVDISASAGAPAAVAGSPLASIGLAGNHYRAYYLDAIGHVQELGDTGNGGWTATDLTLATGSTGAVPGSALTAFTHRESATSGAHVCLVGCDDRGLYSSVSEYPRVYYFSRDGHVQELAYGNQTWHLTDISARSGAAVALAGSAMTSFEYLGSGGIWYPRVYYFDIYRHVRELAWGSGRWNSGDVSASAGTPPAARGSALAAFAWQTNDPKVYHFTPDGHVWELQWWSGWRGGDLSALTCAPAASPGSPLAGFAFYSSPTGIAYLSADSHVHELVQTSSWAHVDLNGAGTSQGCPPAGSSPPPGTPPTASAAVIAPNPIVAEGTLDSGLSTYASATASMPSGTAPFNYAWSVAGDGLSMTTSTNGPTAGFAASYDPCGPRSGVVGTVTVTVTDAQGKSSTTTAPITLLPFSNLAAFCN